MALNKFLLLLLGVYGAYYCFLILMDFVRSKTTSKTSMSTESVHYEVEASQPPIDVRQLAGRENPEETTWDEASGGGEKKRSLPLNKQQKQQARRLIPKRGIKT